MYKILGQNQNCFVLVSQVGVLLHLLYNDIYAAPFSFRMNMVWGGGWKSAVGMRGGVKKNGWFG